MKIEKAARAYLEAERQLVAAAELRCRWGRLEARGERMERWVGGVAGLLLGIFLGVTL